MKHNFEERRQRRLEHAKNMAVRADKESEALYNEASKMASAIPFGQPILVGHHSERRDRNYRDKIHNKYGKAFKTMDKADYYRNKADSIEANDNIYDDDPEALQKLEARLTLLKDLQDFMKSANRCLKKNDKKAFLKLPNTSEKTWDLLNTPNVMGDIGFAGYKLTNNNANIRRITQRIEKLKRIEQREELDTVINGVRIFENHEANRLQVYFEGKPSEDIRKKLKSNGFRWSPSQGAWQRGIGNYALRAAFEIAKSLAT
ncbi:MAG: DUF3560 domain-containing protein [Sphingobacterium sp.]|jgi:hypothetical protein|nr:DUF3560 domain-containing protein [Sphingobacterium sp.]